MTASRIAERRVRKLRIYQEDTWRWTWPRARGVPSAAEWLDAGRGQGLAQNVAERIPLGAPAADALRLELGSFTHHAVRGQGRRW